MQPISVKNLAVNFFRPSYLPVIAGKLWLRIKELKRRKEAFISWNWCTNAAQSLEDFATGLDSQLWAETEVFSNNFQKETVAKMAKLGIDLGGGGDYRLLYFVTRLSILCAM